MYWFRNLLEACTNYETLKLTQHYVTWFICSSQVICDKIQKKKNSNFRGSIFEKNG